MADATDKTMLGKGTRFYLETSAGSAAYEVLAKVTALSPPGETTDSVDVTHMESEDDMREFIPGLTDPGEVSLTLNWIPTQDGDDATDARIRAWRDTRSGKIRFPNGVTWTFDCFRTSYQPDSPMEDKMTAELTMKVSGSKVVGVQTA